MIVEIGKSYVNRYYNGDIRAAIRAHDWNAWTPGKIKATFNFGNGTEKDLKAYMQSNKANAYFRNI